MAVECTGEDLPVYVPRETLASLEVFDFLERLSALPDETRVLWKSTQDDTGRPGVWVVRRTYRLKHGSFIDPTDLACYGAQYYEPDSQGRHSCLQIGYGMDGPVGSRTAQTVGELHEAVRSFLDADDAWALKLLQPDGAFEMHGALTKGWNAVRYGAATTEPCDPQQARESEGVENEEAPEILVFE